MRNIEVGHQWWYDRSGENKRKGTSNFFYEGDTIYSYGKHWPIAKKYQNAVLFQIRKYGTVSTSAHTTCVLRAIPSKIIYVYNFPVLEKARFINKTEERRFYSKNFTEFEVYIKKNFEKLRDKNTLAVRVELKDIAEKAVLFAEYFTQKLPKPLQKLIDAIPDNSKDLKLFEELQKRQQANAQRLNSRALNAWLKGNSNTFPHGIDKVYLRFKNNVLESSQGINIPLAEVKASYNRIAHLIQLAIKGKCNINDIITRNKKAGHKPFEIADYEIQYIYKEQIKIGCHIIENDQLQVIYKKLHKKPLW